MTKKSIQKPENWQDFETLCKKLWGEIFEIPNEIKKNGRSGQAQQGVDIYGIPKGGNKYVGIQCKGNDNYTDAKLTKSEVDNEIEKSKNFKPPLGTLIFATTANKDVSIEEYIRLKNDENDFKILLFSWEDIADLIEDYRNTHDWYVKNLMHKTNYDFRVLFNDFQEQITLQPALCKQITNFVYSERTIEQIFQETQFLGAEIKESLANISKMQKKIQPLFGHSQIINKSWINFDIILENSGSSVLEDWKFRMWFTQGVYMLDDESSPFLLSDISMINLNKDDPRKIDRKKKLITYCPVGKSVLVQKDNRYFNVSIL
ncbi:MAG: hypothetical protein ORN53_05780, partial [Crocinitomicaceae bacterium]|nr:hypothetical protein [Crocinitomicaceae bacterium]